MEVFGNLLVNAALVRRAKWRWAEREGPTRRPDLEAVAEDAALEEGRSDAPEGCKAQPLKGAGHRKKSLWLGSNFPFIVA